MPFEELDKREVWAVWDQAAVGSGFSDLHVPVNGIAQDQQTVCHAHATSVSLEI